MAVTFFFFKFCQYNEQVRRTWLLKTKPRVHNLKRVSIIEEMNNDINMLVYLEQHVLFLMAWSVKEICLNHMKEITCSIEHPLKKCKVLLVNKALWLIPNVFDIFVILLEIPGILMCVFSPFSETEITATME